MGWPIRGIPTVRATLDGTEQIAGQLTAGGAGSSFRTTAAALALQPHYPAATALTGDFTVGSGVTCAAYSNANATVDITLSLGAAVRGKRFLVLKEERGYEFYVDCQFADRFEDFPNGVDLRLIDNGFAEIVCLTDGVWSIVARRGSQDAKFLANRQIYLKTPGAGGSDSNDGLALGTAKATVRGIAAIARPGDVVNVEPGTYTGTSNEFTRQNLPVGNARHPIKFTCATAFGAIFPKFRLTYVSTWDIPGARWYLDFENLVWKGNTEKLIQGGNLRFFRCAGIDGPTDAGVNESIFAIGGGDGKHRGAFDILMEDCVAFGSGGRYRFLAYNCARVIVRRGVARWDDGWTYSAGTGHQAGDFILYDSEDSEMQNCLSVDSRFPVGASSQYKASFTLEQNYYHSDNLAMRGCMVVNNLGTGFRADSLTTNAASATYGGTVNRKMRARNWTFEDCAVGLYGDPSFTGHGVLIGGGLEVDLQNITVAGNRRFISTDFLVDANPKWTGLVRARNLVSARGSGAGTTHYSLPAHVAAVGNLSYTTLAAAKTAGLTHLPRPDAASTIENGYAGATIIKRIGADGSMYGDPNYRRHGDGSTASDLWPWPNQAAIKTLMQGWETDNSVAARDWTAGSKTLTNYVWGILGTDLP